MYDPIFDIFREEAREHLNALEQGFLDLETTTDLTGRTQLIGKLFRHAHNIKGDARALDISMLQQASGILEETLETFRESPAVVDQSQIELGLAQLDVLRRSLHEWQGNFLEGITSDSTTSEPARFVDENEAEVNSSSDDQFLEDPQSESVHATEVGSDSGEVRKQPSAQMSVPNMMEDTSSIRVSADRLDRMLNLVGEVRVIQRSDFEIQRQLKDLRGRLEDLADRLHGEWRTDLEGAFDHVRRIESSLHQKHSREQVLMQSLEEDVSEARLLPLSLLTDSLRRSIRDLAHSLNKEVKYLPDVGDVLLDKVVIEALRTPLLHLIRNAVDHGIEYPDVRRRQNKPASGTIRIEAKRRGEKVEIRVSDDGAGANFEKIRSRVLSMGQLSQHEVDELTEDQLMGYLFQPGFSTAAIGEISGRGVGLDVVRDAIQRIQGRVEISAKAGKGTTFSLMLPVTISTIRVLTVWCSGQSFALPSESILKTGRASLEEIREIKGTTIFTYDGAPIRWVQLADLLGLGKVRIEQEHPTFPYVIVKQEGQAVAVQVDDVDEEREVLLKSLGFPLSGLPGVWGGTIRPDGSVELVLDLTGKLLSGTGSDSRMRSESQQSRSPNILVVDDSPTTRALLRNVFIAAGYQVQTAVDGIDAMEKLRVQRPDAVVSDFEMPRLNGVDLTRQIKSKWNLPVILVTGREQEQHRREGLEAGADAYLVKSGFRGESLLDVVKQFIAD
ncbi:hybrid sensor histidine kinase/response regulator [Planctomicrobium sp. SH668]|uniref:hybrid sensor histidine kinase/response regulator n=1 Tax=Planctomicrobium sp. SH668 TaxID=3448126 RepID=UPI003F5BC8B0